MGYGYIEIRELGGGWYGLYIDGVLKEQSTNLSYIQQQYDKY